MNNYKRIIFLTVAAIFLLFSLCGCAPSKGEDEGDTADAEAEYEYIDDDTAFANEDFPYTDVSKEVNDRVSIFSWDLVFMSEENFPQLASVLARLGVNRIYQDVPQEFLSSESTVKMVKRFEEAGVQTVFLTGDSDWLADGLEDYFARVDALKKYNEGVGAQHPIPGIALDVEAYVLDEWKEDPAGVFADYVPLMQEAYDYAHERGFFVVQVVPNFLDTTDRELFEEFLATCCDELSVMNYKKDFSANGIWNEVYACRRAGIPIESVSETMPENDYYTVTEAETYFGDGLEALLAGEDEIRRVYGGDVGISYHQYNCVYHVATGAYLFNLYPYTSGSDPAADENGQADCGEPLVLSGDDGSEISAWIYHPNGEGERHEFCYLACGIKEGVKYELSLESSAYRIDQNRSAVMEFSMDNISLLSEDSFHVRPK